MNEQDRNTAMHRLDAIEAELATPCVWCSDPAKRLGTRCCDRCWELHDRITERPDLARKMLDSLTRSGLVLAGL